MPRIIVIAFRWAIGLGVAGGLLMATQDNDAPMPVFELNLGSR